MIQYTLICENEHRFDAWFRSAEMCAQQMRQGIVECPVCGSGKVQKALMAPTVSTGSRPRKMSLTAGHPERVKIRAAMKALREKVTAEADYVGDKFAEEARKIHEETVEPRGIYGEATAEEVSGLVEDGVEFMPLPALPEEQN